MSLGKVQLDCITEKEKDRSYCLLTLDTWRG